MEESSFYQMVLEKGMERGLEAGRVDEVRAMLIRAGSRQLGSPSPAVLSVLQSVMNRASLEAMTDRLFDRSVASWDELLGS